MATHYHFGHEIIYHPNMIHLVILALFVGLSASNTRLAMHDDISIPLRKKLLIKYGDKHFVNRMLECERCTAFWATIPASALVLAGYIYAFPHLWWAFLIAAVPVHKAVAYYGFLLLRRE